MILHKSCDTAQVAVFPQRKRKAQLEKEALKRAARQHRDRVVSSERTAELLGQQLEHAVRHTHILHTVVYMYVYVCMCVFVCAYVCCQNSELEGARGELARLTAERMRQQTEVSTLTT